MIQLLLAFIMLILFLVAFFLTKKQTELSTVLGANAEPLLVKKAIRQLAIVCCALGILGIAFILLNQKIAALLYIALVLLFSAIYTTKLAKTIA